MLIITDVDEMGVEEFLVKIDVWSRLLEAEAADGASGGNVRIPGHGWVDEHRRG